MEQPVLVGLSDDDTGADLEPFDHDGEILWTGWREDVEADRDRSTDAIAWYQPWHLFGDDWGIFFDGRLWRTRVRRFARAVQRSQRISSDEIERHVFDQILAHERTHFATKCSGPS